MSSYPKWIYHSEYPAKVVHSAEEHAEHDGWKEAPVVSGRTESEIEVAPEKPKRGRKPKATDSPEISEQ